MKPLLCLFGLAAPLAVTSASPEIIKLWDIAPPLAVANDKPESEMPPSNAKAPAVLRIGNISTPTISVFHPPASKRNGTCILICPGGGYSIVAFEHEGTQVAEWLNTLGVTAAVLKYRVPAPKGEPAHLRPLLDAQRAMSLIRARAKDWNVNPNRVGALGFSAGGNLCAWLMCEGNSHPDGYPATPAEPPCRPDFGILIYPAYLAATEKNRPMPVIRPDAKPGPAFFVHASDDKLGPENSIEFFLALKKAGVPGELHVYQEGGHGFGMLQKGQPINDWAKRCEDWLRARQLLDTATVP